MTEIHSKVLTLPAIRAIEYLQSWVLMGPQLETSGLPNVNTQFKPLDYYGPLEYYKISQTLKKQFIKAYWVAMSHKAGKKLVASDSGDGGS